MTVSMGIEKSLLTDKDGNSKRIRVDVGQTGFFDGREVRTYKELSIAPLGEYVLRFVAVSNFIMMQIAIAIEAGTLKYESFAGGTPGGSFSETLPIVLANQMTEVPIAYTPTMVITAGGTITGGTALDISRLKANANTNFATTVGDGESNVRGYPAGTYFVKLTNLSATDTVTGTLKFRWEERP